MALDVWFKIWVEKNNAEISALFIGILNPNVASNPILTRFVSKDIQHYLVNKRLPLMVTFPNNM